MGQRPEALGERTSKATRRKDPTLAVVDDISNRVRNMEYRALEAAAQKWQIVGLAALKVGFGGASISDSIFHNIHFWSGDGPNIIGLIVGSALLVYGLGDAGKIPEVFRRARDLMTDSRMLRSSLTAATDDVIRGIPYRALEQPVLSDASSTLPIKPLIET